MGKKVIENHKVVEQNSQGAAEDLIKQQNMEEGFVLGEKEEENQQKEEQQEGNKIGVVDQEESSQELLGNFVETTGDVAKLTMKEEGQQKKGFEGTVVLTGAATYLDSGIRYFKNKPVKVVEQRVYEQLLKTGLFIHL